MGVESASTEKRFQMRSKHPTAGSPATNSTLSPTRVPDWVHALPSGSLAHRQSTPAILLCITALDNSESVGQYLLTLGYRPRPVTIDRLVYSLNEHGTGDVVASIIDPDALDKLGAHLPASSPLYLLRMDRVAKGEEQIDPVPLARPSCPADLQKLMADLLGPLAPPPLRVLHIDSANTPTALGEQLAAQGVDYRPATPGSANEDDLIAFDPDIVFIDRATQPTADCRRELAARQESGTLNISSALSGREPTDTPVIEPDHVLSADTDIRATTALLTALARRAQSRRMLHEQLAVSEHIRQTEWSAVDQHAIVSMTDRQGNIVYVNERFCLVSGYSEGELLGANHRILQSGRHSAAFYTDMWQSIASGGTWQGEICNRRKDGSLYWVRSTISPMLDKEGRPEGYISVRTDVTPLKRTEDRLRLLERAVESSPMGVSIADATQPDYPLIFVNPAFTYLTGYTASEATGRSCRFLQGSDRDQPEVETLRSAIAQKRGAEVTLRNYRKNGQMFWNRLVIAPIHDEQSRLTHYVGIQHDVTERVEAIRSMEQSESRLRRSQTYANIGTWEWDIVSGALTWSERIPALFGLEDDVEDLSFARFEQCIHPDDRPAVNQAIEHSLQTDATYHVEHRVVWADGTAHWLLEQGAVVRDEDGKPIKMLGVVSDINEQKRAEIALAERERLLLEAQSLAQLGDWHANLVTGEVQWSDEVYRIFGHEPGSITTSIDRFYEAVHPEDRQKVRDTEAHWRAGGTYDVMHRILLPDGRVRHVHERARAAPDDSGDFVRLDGTAQDVTDLVTARQQLEDVEGRFRFAIEGAGDGIWDWNVRSGEMLFSGNYGPMLGYRPEDLSPTFSSWLQSIHPDDLDRAQTQLGAYFDGMTDGFYQEIRLQTAEEDYRWILCRARIHHRDHHGAPERVIGIHTDITGQKTTEQALRYARWEADKANQAKSEFLSNMSHELRTPMNAIIGFGQLLEYDDRLPQDLGRDVTEILKAGHHLLELINEILDLARVESGKIELSLEPLDVVAVINECFALVEPLANNRGITLHLADNQPAIVEADRTRLKQALLNLISNAIKYNREGGSVTCQIDRETDTALICVEDTGHGIPAERMDELFQPFSRLEADRAGVEGTGIGLAYTRRIVELMHGHVSAESEVNKGSRFCIKLKTCQLPTTTREDAENTDRTSELAPGSAMPEKTVLYVEDNPSNIKLVAAILERRPSINLLTAHQPRVGLNLAREYDPDLILLDINMPGLDGFQVLEILRDDPSVSRQPVVAITANAMASDVRQGMQAGFDDYLTKPLDVERFLEVVDHYLYETNGSTLETNNISPTNKMP